VISDDVSEANIRDAIQAAWAADHHDLAEEIAARYGLTGVCLRCTAANPEVRIMKYDRTGPTLKLSNESYPICMACSDAEAEASSDYDPDFDKRPRHARLPR
jgi:ribosomal protein L40E